MVASESEIENVLGGLKANPELGGDSRWFDTNELPGMRHGKWELSVVADLLP
jgi:hypothetical protein